MNSSTDNRDERNRRDYGWVLEVLIFAAVTPALVYGVLSLNQLPVV